MRYAIVASCLVAVVSIDATCPACSVVDGNFVLTVVCEAICGLTSSSKVVRRSEGLKVIGAGLGRTGTASLQEAFGILGFKSYHMSEVLIQIARGDTDKWAAALQNNSIKDILPMLLDNGYDASADEPVNHFTLQLMEAFPDAKVVLTSRADVNKWVSSVHQISEAMAAFDLLPWSWVFGRFSAFARSFHMARGYELITEFDKFDKQAAAKYYNEWNAKIRSSVPPARLLDFQVQQGWGPLCSFLEVPIPKVPFPTANDKAGMKLAINVLTVLHYMFRASPIFACLCLSCCFSRCRSSRTKAKRS